MTRNDEHDIVERAKMFIREYFEGEGSGHDYWHSLHVYQTAMKLAETEGGNTEIVALAALLHDVDDYKLVGEEAEKCQQAKEFLRSVSYPEEGIAEICDIIERVSFSSGLTEETLEGKIVQDADRLDGMGAMGIARAFAYGGAHGREIYNPEVEAREDMTKEEYRKNKGSSVNHFYEKLLKLKDLMNTETAKKMAEERHQFMVEFLEEFMKEWRMED